MKLRQLWLLFHRWGGLLLAIPLILVALTGSIIAFTKEVNRYLITPERYATVQPGVPQLGVEVLAKHAQALIQPGESIVSMNVGPDFTNVRIQPQTDPSAKAERGGENKAPLVYAIWLDPWTGKELARQYPVNGEPIRDNRLMRFFHALHDHLYLGRELNWVLGIIALLWTVDCFVSWYLTLPNSSKEFWRRWKPAWQIKFKASTYRLNFDLHRANGLWLWPMLFVFAWSSVQFNLKSVYYLVTKTVFEYQPKGQMGMGMTKLEMEKYKTHGEPQPDLKEILATGRRLAIEEGTRQGIALGEPQSFNKLPGSSLATLMLRLDTPDCRDNTESKCGASLQFDSKTGTVVEFKMPKDELQNEPTGNFVTRWLRILHKGQTLGLWYQIFVCILGIVIAMLSVTGIYVWWKKRKARQHSEAKKAEAELESKVMA